MHAIIQRQIKAAESEGLQQPRGGGLCQTKPMSLSLDSSFSLLCVNIQGLISHSAELFAHLELIGLPFIVGVTETWLSNNVGNALLPGYSVISQRDRHDGRRCGGIALFARVSVASQIVHVADSVEHERAWYILHTDCGAISIGLWYRPPSYDEVASIDALLLEHAEYSQGCIGTIIIGDMNVHHKSWLKFSNSTSIAGRALFDVCCRLGLQQCVQEPTRNEYLLDLVLTDLDNIVKTRVLPKVADHNAVLNIIRTTVLQSVEGKRKVWKYDAANWDGMEAEITNMDWRAKFESMHPEGIADYLTKFLLGLVDRFVPTAWIKVKNACHPWLSSKSWLAIEEKRNAEKGMGYLGKQRACTAQVHEDYCQYVKAMKKKADVLTTSPKQWWKLSSRLMMKSGGSSSIPPLRKSDGSWAMTPKSKADLLASTFKKKFSLPRQVVNEYTVLDNNQEKMMGGF